MPTAINKKPIAFENNREAIAVFPPAGAKAEDIIGALEITSYKAVLLVIGGADSVDEKLKARLTQVFSRGVARAAATINAVIIDGGTQAGVMAMMGEGVADRGFFMQGDRVDDEPAFTTFDLSYLFHLLINAHILVEDTNTSLPGKRHGQGSLRHGIHGCRQHGYIQRNLFGELTADIDFAG